MLRKFLKDEKGQGMVEYILIVALIAVAAIVMVRLFGTKISQAFQRQATTVENNTPGG